MSDPVSRKTVALVGRPNVGKSALFNRLIGRRVSIVHDEVGVTRDRVMGEVNWDGRAFTLVDTGGIGSMDRARESDDITRGAYQQVDLALAEAAVVIFVVDVQTGIHPLDESVSARLRRQNIPIFVAANKADLPQHEMHAAEFARLGFPVFPISALHGRGLDDLLDRVLSVLPHQPNPTVTRPLRVAVVGRPNAGKSSFINRLLCEERVIVSDVPGTTRDSIDVPFTVGEGESARHYRLVDTAGLRARKRLDSAVDAFSVARTEEAIRRSDIVVWMIDAKEGPSRQDKRIADQIAEHHRGCVRIVNKWDLMKKVSTQREYREALDQNTPFLAYAPLLFMSAQTGVGVSQAMETIDEVSRQVNTEVTTGLLNRTLRDAFDRQLPPSIKGKRLKLYYATQTGTRPPRIRLFVNDPTLRSNAYEHYLVNRLRDAFGLAGAPVILQWRARGSDSKSEEGQK